MSPDISMCQNDDCPSKLKCYRYMAKPSQWQSYYEFRVPPRRKKCDDYIKWEVRQ